MNAPRLPLAKARSWAQIEFVARRLLQRHAPRHLATPGPLDVVRLIEVVLPKHLGTDFSVAELRPPCEAMVTPAIGGGRPQLLLASHVYDGLYQDRPRARFTAVHEVGHAVLHIDDLKRELTSNGRTALYRKSNIAPYCDPDRQADVFAARMLMPTTAMRLALTQVGPSAYEIARLFHVSERAAAIRIGEIGGRG